MHRRGGLAVGVRIVERESELAHLGRLVERAIAGAGAMLVIEGEAGLGKTALLSAALQLGRERGMRVLSARAAEAERDFAYGMVRQLYEREVVGLARPEWDAAFDGPAALAGPLLGLRDRTGLYGPSALNPAFAAQHGIYWLTANLAARVPLMLVVDDAQWSDIASLRCLTYLARRYEGIPVCVLIGWRRGEPGSPEELLRVMTAEAGVERVSPRPLSEAGSAALVRSMLGQSADSGLCGICHRRTLGNPFLLTELARALDADSPADPQGRLELAARLGPDSVRQSLLLRLSRERPEAAAVARAVAILDSGASARHTAALAEIGADELVACVERLTHASILHETSTLAFVHPITRSVVYEDMTAVAREAAHRRAAALLAADGEIEQAAVHLLVTPPAGDREVVSLLRTAASRSLRHGAPDAAANLLERALAEPPLASERPEVLFELGHAEMLAGHSKTITHLREAWGVATKPGLRAGIARELGGALAAGGQPAAALELLTDLADELADDDHCLALSLEADAAAVAQVSGELRARHSERLSRIAEASSGSSAAGRRLLVAYAYSRVASGESSAVEVAELLDRARESGGVFGDEESWPSLSPSISWAIACEVALDRVEDAHAHASAELERSSARGAPLGVLTCAGYLARVAYVLGDLERAESQGQLALQAADAIAPTFYMDWPASQLAMILVERGAPEEAERVLQHCGYAGAELPRGTFAAHFLAEARIALWLAQGQIDRAVADAGLLWRMVRGRGSRPMLATRGLSALALLAAGRRDEARAVAETELQASARWGLASGQGMALRALGVVEGGTDGIALLQQAVDQLEPTPRRLELIRALVDLGSALRLDRRRSDAQEPLRRALELASAAGARALRERARTELLLCGARPRRDERAGRDALTAAERRVAEMVAAGHGNTQVAQALFVTRRTVETHLSSIYRKLGISGRAQLAEAMQAELTSVG